MKPRFLVRLLGVLIIIQDAVAILIGDHFRDYNRTVWLVVILIVGLLFLAAPKWLIDFLTGDKHDDR